MITFAFPCHLWSPLQTVFGARNFGGKLSELRDEEEERFFSFIGSLCRLQVREGRLALAENPWQSRAWARKVFDSLIVEGLFELVRGDGCAYQKRLPRSSSSVDDGLLLQKPTGYLVPKGSALRITMSLRCTKDHPHGAIIGGKWTATTVSGLVMRPWPW